MVVIEKWTGGVSGIVGVGGGGVVVGEQGEFGSRHSRTAIEVH
jgi:hypothetical protein